MNDFIEEFVGRSAEVIGPDNYKRWGAIAAMSAVMSRRVYTEAIAYNPVFANMFIGLSGPPGTGKSQTIKKVRDILNDLPFSGEIGMTANKITQEGLITRLKETFRGVGEPSVIGLIGEFGTFMPEPNVSFTQGLANMWDGESFSYDTKHAKEEVINDPYFCMLFGVQPAWFAETFPPSAFQMGLPARIILAHSPKPPLVKGSRRDDKVRLKDSYGLMRSMLSRAHKCRGLFRLTDEALERWEQWSNAKDPAIIDPMLNGYDTRRPFHTLKLALVLAVANHPQTREVGLEDLEKAMAMLFEIEPGMSQALAIAGGSPYRMYEEVVLAMIHGKFSQGATSVHEYMVRNELSRFIGPNMIEAMVDSMIARQVLRVVGSTSKPPNRTLTLPIEKKGKGKGAP